MIQENTAGINVANKRSEIFKPHRELSGVTVWRSENPKTSDSHVALYKFNPKGKLIIACVTPSEVDTCLKTLEFFRYEDAKALLNKTISIEEYSTKIGFMGDELPVVPEVQKPEVKIDPKKVKAKG